MLGVTTMADLGSDDAGFLGSLAFWLVIIGALNWGLVGAANFDVVNSLLGGITWLQDTVYILVGLSGIYMIFAE